MTSLWKPMSTKGSDRDWCHCLTGGSCCGLSSIHYIKMWVDCKVMTLFGRLSRGLLRNMISILGCPKRKGSGWQWQETVTPRVYGWKGPTRRILTTRVCSSMQQGARQPVVTHCYQLSDDLGAANMRAATGATVCRFLKRKSVQE